MLFFYQLGLVFAYSLVGSHKYVVYFLFLSQVHTFSCMLVDNVVAYGDQSRTEDTASLRLISTQAPALMSALEVMVEQCYKR